MTSSCKNGQSPWCHTVSPEMFTLTHPPTPRAAYMGQKTRWALVQIMACRLFGAKPLSKPMIGYWNTLQWNPDHNSNNFIQENHSENVVCEMAAILLRGLGVNGNAIHCTYTFDMIIWPFSEEVCWLAVSGVDNVWIISRGPLLLI